MTRADAFYELGAADALNGRSGRNEFVFEFHADFENYLIGRRGAKVS